MKYLIGLLFLVSYIPLFSQEYRDIKSWLDKIDISTQSDLSNETKPVYEIILPRLSRPLFEEYTPVTESGLMKFYDSDKFVRNISGKAGLHKFRDQVSFITNPAKRLTIQGINLSSKSKINIPENLVGKDVKIEYKLSDKISLNVSGYYILNNYKNPVILQSILFKSEIGTNLSFKITKNLTIKTGMQYQHNLLTKNWEYMYMTGLVFTF